MATFRFTSLVLLAACLFTGCAKFDIRKGIPWIPGEDGELERPMKISAVWTETIMSHGDAPPVRGFGGRIMFYAREDAKPVKVEGSIVVYAFEERNRDPRNIKPDKKYVLSEEEFEKHHSKEKMGHTYSIWIPWDKVGGPQTEISLMVRFMPKGGGVVVGEQQTCLLPGIIETKPAEATTARATPVGTVVPAAGSPSQASSIQQATYVETPGSALRNEAQARHNAPFGEPMDGRRMTTTTIPITAGPGNRFPSAIGSAANVITSPRATGASQAAAGAAPDSPHASPPQSPNSQPLGWAQTPPPAGQSSAHFGPGRLRPLGAPIAQLNRDHGPWRPNPATQPSVPAAIHQSAPQP